jgi:hypothetical protein
MRSLHAWFVAELRDQRGRRYLELPPKTRAKRVRFLEKTPENALRVPFLEAAFADARFIFLHRDPRPNISSIIEAWRHGGLANIPVLPGWQRGPWCFLLPEGWRNFAEAELSEVAAFQWRAANETAMHDLGAIPRERWAVVEYQDLVAEPEAVLRRLCERLELRFDARLQRLAKQPLQLSSTTITPPSPIKWRQNKELRESSFDTLGLVHGRLRNLEVRPAALPAPRRDPTQPIRYACFLDDLPPRAVEFAEPPTVERSFCYQLGATPPLPIVRRTRFRERFVANQPVLWVEDATTGAVLPFWGRRSDANTMLGVHAGRHVTRNLDSRLATALVNAGILDAAPIRAARLASAEEAMTSAAERLRVERLCKLQRVLHPGHIRALAAYYEALIRSGQPLGDGQVERRHGWHNEPIARFFHHQLGRLVSRVAGESIKPTYCYSSAYRGGAALKAHIDREQCEYTLSLLVDQSEGFAREPWPLCFLGPMGKAAVTLAVGEAVLFMGCELPHWREQSSPREHQLMLLFHYVKASFQGVLD